MSKYEQKWWKFLAESKNYATKKEKEMNKKTALNKAIQSVKNKTNTKSKTKTKGKLNPGLQAFLNKKKKMAKNKNKMA